MLPLPDMKGFLTILWLFGAIAGYSQPSGDDISYAPGNKGPQIYRENGLVGLQNNRHKPITPAVYDTLYRVNNLLFAGKRFNATRQQSLWGIINANGERVVPFSFTVLKVTKNIVVVGQQQHNLIRYGAYSLAGNVLINPQYESVEVLSGRFLAAIKNHKAIIVNNQGIKLTEIDGDTISLLPGGLIKFSNYGKTGVSSFSRGLVVPAAYQDIKIENDGLYVKDFPAWQIITGYDTLLLNYDHIHSWDGNYIVSINHKSWLLNRQDQPLSKQYDTIISTGKKLALVKRHHKWGVINNKGAEIIPVNYRQIAFDDENIRAKITDSHPSWVLFDFYGYQRSKLRYDSIGHISEGRIAIMRNNRWGYLNRYGVEVIPPVYDQVSPFTQDRAVVTLHGEDGVINRQGKWLALPAPIKIMDIGNDIILGKANNQYQIKRFSGELIYFTGNRLQKFDNEFYELDSADVIIRKISPGGTFIYEYPEGEGTRAGGAGLLIFKANNRYGFKDQQGRIVIANRYEQVKSFNQRMAAVKINNHWGFINLDEQIIIQPLYDSVGFFRDGTCIVQKQGLSGVVNLQGATVLPSQYEQIIRLNDGNFMVKKKGKWGVLSHNGEIIIHPKYDQLTPVSQGYYIVARNGRYGTLDMNGVNKIPLLYDYIAYDEQSKTLVTRRSPKNDWAFLKKTQLSN